MESLTNLLLRNLLLLCSFSFSLSASHFDDVAAISAIAKSLVGVPYNWKPGTDPCNWTGITCTSGRITSVDLNAKSISGSLPNAVANLSGLENLNLGQNQISGPIPSLAGLSNLQTLDLRDNAFTTVPDNLFSGVTSLRSVTLDNNPLSPWPISVDLVQCVSLRTFSAANATITGTVPDIFVQLPTLTELKLSYNNLIGNLPSSFAGSSIQQLYLDNQQEPGFSGSIHVLRAMPQLKLVWLQSNGFTGSIPDLSNLTSLTTFIVRDNQLTGPVPASVISCHTLKDIALSNNLLQGPFPMFPHNVTTDMAFGNRFCNPDSRPCDPRVMTLLSVAGGFGYPLDLARVWRGNDPCRNKWTHIVCDLEGYNIVVLQFPGMHYEGTISPEIAMLTSLTMITLNDNNLTGSIPDVLTKLPQLQLLDVTNNNLTGKLPSFPPSVSVKASGNPLLARDGRPGTSDNEDPASSSSGRIPQSPTARNASGAIPHSPSPSTRNSSGGSHSVPAAVIGGLVATVFVLMCCSVCLIYNKCHKSCIRKFRRVRPRSGTKDPETTKINMHVDCEGWSDPDNQRTATSSGNSYMAEDRSMLFSFHELQMATDDFNELNILGRGGFGVVYKGEHKGTLIAVKRTLPNNMGGEGKEELRAEIDLLKKIRHRNLVGLLGYCMNGNEWLLVYQYMPEGTLGQHLFVRNENGCSSLSWKQRLVIALDVARGLEYLHSLAQESFIHRDLKPSNILLDKDLRAKVSDFGLVKLVDSEMSMKTRVAGTFGYLAPEYVITGRVTTKVDVYAYGVILMELITGRKALDNSLPDEESILVTFFRKDILDKENFMKHVDPTLVVEEEACSNIPDIAELACLCTAREANQRPGMNHVVEMLRPLVNKWNPSHYDAKGEDDSSMSLTVSLTHRLAK